MKKFIYLILAATISMSFGMKVNALNANCTQDEMIYLRDKASNTKITYDYVESYQGFKVTITGLSSTIFAKYSGGSNGSITYNETTSTSADNFVPGYQYKFEYYSTGGTPCIGQYLITKIITLPYVNPYAGDSLCVGHETYELCKKFTVSKAPTYDQFVIRVKNYIRSLTKDEEKEPTKETTKVTESIWEKGFNFFVDNSLFFLVPIIVLGTAGIIIINVKKRRDSIL